MYESESEGLVVVVNLTFLDCKVSKNNQGRRWEWSSTGVGMRLPVTFAYFVLFKDTLGRFS